MRTMAVLAMLVAVSGCSGGGGAPTAATRVEPPPVEPPAPPPPPPVAPWGAEVDRRRGATYLHGAYSLLEARSSLRGPKPEKQPPREADDKGGTRTQVAEA